jgi:hypothetical protein
MRYRIAYLLDAIVLGGRDFVWIMTCAEDCSAFKAFD